MGSLELGTGRFSDVGANPASGAGPVDENVFVVALGLLGFGLKLRASSDFERHGCNIRGMLKPCSFH